MAAGITGHLNTLLYTHFLIMFRQVNLCSLQDKGSTVLRKRNKACVCVCVCVWELCCFSKANQDCFCLKLQLCHTGLFSPV